MKMTLLNVKDGVKMDYHHRDDDNLAYIEYYEDGSLKCERWFKEGKKHRKGDNPSIIEYYRDTDNIVKYKGWSKNNKFYRYSNKATCEGYYSNGSLKYKVYYQDNKSSIVEYRRDQRVKSKTSYKKIVDDKVEEIYIKEFYEGELKTEKKKKDNIANSICEAIKRDGSRCTYKYKSVVGKVKLCGIHSKGK